jgi:Uncharacterized protein conserved in bacteria (DUF2188)
MAKVEYKIVQHDGGWAYQVENTYSETYTTRENARSAARIAAGEQVVAGKDVGITYEDASGKWHEELSEGDDRPQPTVTG